MTEPRIAFKAGRCFRREGTSFVDASPTKGAIILQNGEDGLLHFMWKNRQTNNVEEDLILFPSDAVFQKVEQSAWGRTYILKFASSNQRHFFWMQDADPSRDAEFVSNVNRLLDDPQTIPIWWAPGYNPGHDAQASTSSALDAAPTAGSSQAASSSQPASGQAHQPTVEELAQVTAEELAQVQSLIAHRPTAQELAQVQSIIASMSGGSGQQGILEMSLVDILTPNNLAPLFSEHPELVHELFPHLPPDLPTHPTEETLRQIVSSPQFRAAVRNFDQALRTGLLGGLVRGLGLPEEAGTSIEAFLRAIQEQARAADGESEGDRMDTD